LKQALRDRVPADILSRQKKGFGIPLARWLKTMDPPSSPVPTVDNTWLRGRWASHKAGHKIGNGDDRLALWCWMALSHGLKP